MSLEEKRIDDRRDDHDANRDPITGQPGSHPVGTGVGAAGLGAAGTAVGAVVGGPVGAVVGAAAGAVAGGLAGKGAAEMINPTAEEEYWRSNYASTSYAEPDQPYDYYAPAYSTGYMGYNNYYGTGRSFDELEPDLRRDYESYYESRGHRPHMSWDRARYATRDAWDRAERIYPRDRERHNR